MHMISNILQQKENFDFEKYNLDIIVTEITDISLNKLEIYNFSIEKILETKLYKLLIEKNYKLINWVNADLIFVKKNFQLKSF